jgi:pre-mRNA-processing factor 39
LHDLFIQIIAAEYMLTRYNEEMPKEPPWLQYMREWGPKFDYDKTAMLNNILKYLPQQIRVPLQDIISKLPDEVLGQEGPTGPKQKNNWFGDERDHL